MKSHGTLQYQNGLQEVLITAQDLRYLAGEIDRLEDLVDALNMRNNPSIVYEYHTHTDGNGIVYPQGSVISGYSNPGGCFQYSYHEHDSACNYRTWHTHEHCYEMGSEDNRYTIHHCTSHSEHTGDTRNNRWSCSCGKTAGQLVGAHITFN